MPIEVELRSFISQEKYVELMEFFSRNAEFIGEDIQETEYLGSENDAGSGKDLRIQKNQTHSKIWLKKGKIHDEKREEIEVKFERHDYNKVKSLLNELGHRTKIRWFRKRTRFDWDGVDVSLDNTKGYGYIIELELLVEDNEQDEALELLKRRFEKLNIKITSREEFDRKFRHYSENWEQLLKED